MDCFEIDTVCKVTKELKEICQLLKNYKVALLRLKNNLQNFDQEVINKSVMGAKATRNFEVNLLGAKSQENQYLIKR
jgi:hypothetical protein